jgi:DNA-directed RNA polymerase II subunit RPB1
MIVSPQANRPVMGIVQDALLACYLFTRRDTFFDKASVMNTLMWIPQWDGILPTPAILKPRPLWTGKQLFSILIPKGTHVSTYHSTHPDDEKGLCSVGDTKVIIDDGELLSGIVCKKTVGTARGGLIHVIWNDHGPVAASDFLDGCQFVMSYWLTHHSFSVGIADGLFSKETNDAINENTAMKAK